MDVIDLGINMERYEVNKILEKNTNLLSDLRKKINPEKLLKEKEKLEKQMLDKNFWSNQKKAANTTKKVSTIDELILKLTSLEKKHKELLEWLEIAEEQTESWEILETDLKSIIDELSEFQVLILLDGPYDNTDAILEIHPGAGGTESQDFAQMLYRMYIRYTQKKGFSTKIIDYQAGDEAGIKSVGLLVKGPYAYGYLKSEIGVHRLVRISPFDTNKKRHTSFVSVDVYPQIEPDTNLKIDDKDLRIDVYHSSGAGGQSVNTTDSAVRITHIPTGIVVTCQNERSQIKNRETAMNLLKSRLTQLKIDKHEEELNKLKGIQRKIEWGSQIRSYVMQPYQLVKDYRTNTEVGNVSEVLDGNIDVFIHSYLKDIG